MKRKIFVIFVTLLLVLSAIISIVPEDLKVEATPGGGGDGGNEGICLYFDYIWNRTQEFANVIYEYPTGYIPKGRAFGTWGANYTVKNILIPKMNAMGLANVEKLPLGFISDYFWRQYSSKMVTEDFQLTINNHSDESYPFNPQIPITEIFPFPMGQRHYKHFGLSFNYSFTNALINVSKNISYNEDEYPIPGFCNDSIDITYEALNFEGGTIIGNASYIATGESIPDDPDEHECAVFLIDEDNESEDKINNATNATACILIYNNTRGYKFQNATNKSIPVLRTNISDNEDNITAIIDLLENGTWMLADNYLQNGNITFLYNYNESLEVPDDDWFFLTDNFWDAKNNSSRWRNRNIYNYVNKTGKPYCLGYIFYGFSNYTHLMSFTSRKWQFDGLYNGGYYNSPGLPLFSINKSVGSWLFNHANNTTVSGYLVQEWKQQWPCCPGVEAYNVVGYRNISNNPDDKTVILSNRYDGWWGQTPGDSGIGGAILLGIAKYMTDYDITPKCNITFLFTDGEEYGMRGSYHFKDSHPENDNLDYTLFITLDQLGILATNKSDLELWLSYNNYENYNGYTISDILNEIIKMTKYKDRTGYENVTTNTGYNATDAYPWRDTLNVIAFHKRGDWEHHKTGMNYAEGDSLKNMDRNDTNVTAELAWNITKYFTVNPDCWFDNIICNVTDSDDADELVDTVTFSFDVISTLPHDLAMVNNSLREVTTTAYPPPTVIYETMNFTVNRSATSKTVNITLPEGESPGFFTFINDLYNSTGRINEIIDPSGDNANQTETSGMSFLYPYNYSYITPVITNVSATPDPVGYGFNVTINADVTSNVSDIAIVTVNVTYPNSSLQSFNMTNTVGDTYEYVFNDTWQHGKYKYVIWAKDSNGNVSGSSQYSFNVSAEATISVCTEKDSYGGSDIIHLTDPPGDGGGSLQQIGYELLDDEKVLHMWNRFDSYYFNTSNGIQFTNHYDEYWSHNVLILGYYNNDEWNLIYRTDELSGFNKDIDSDKETFVNATLWKDLTYGGYDFRLAIRYHLGVNDRDLTIIPYIKNLGEVIPYNLGFAWEIKDIQVDMTPENDYIEINGTTYFLDGVLDETYKNMANPSFYIREDITSNKSESLYLRWSENLNDIVQVKSRDGQYNAPVTLGIKIGTLDVDQEKFTSLFWHDASEVTYYFNNYDFGFLGEKWATNPSYMVDGNTSTFASTIEDGDVELCIGNTCDSNNGTISKVELRAHGYYSGSNKDIILRPVFFGTGDGDNHTFGTTTTAAWSQWFDITNDTNAPSNWTWNDIKNLDCDVEADTDDAECTLYCSKVEIRVSYTIGNESVISDPYPSSGSIGIDTAPTLNITVFDADGDNMNITWYSNSSGSWQIFGTNSSVKSGTYHQTFSNATTNGKWWYWKVNVSDGINYVESDVFSFYTGYESKINNTGSTNFSGYLLMQIDYFNETSQEWIFEKKVVNETTPRVINSGNVLALDTIFNAQNVNTSTFTHGNGTYRVYAAFRDPDGNVLYVGSSSEDQESEGNDYLEAWYEFTVTYD